MTTLFLESDSAVKHLPRGKSARGGKGGLLVLILILISSCFFPAGAQCVTTESYQYDLSLAGLNVGSMTLAVKNNESTVEITSTMNSAPAISGFYKVRDETKSVLKLLPSDGGSKTQSCVPLSYNAYILEGPHLINKKIEFDAAKKTISYKDNSLKQPVSFMITEPTFDPLSTLYCVRYLPLKVGSPVTVNVFNNSLNYGVEVLVLRKELVDTPEGKVNALVLATNMDNVGDGIFYYPGNIYVWITDDERRIPVKIEKKLTALAKKNIPDFLNASLPDSIKEKLSAGSVTATLVKPNEKKTK